MWSGSPRVVMLPRADRQQRAQPPSTADDDKTTAAAAAASVADVVGGGGSRAIGQAPSTGCSAAIPMSMWATRSRLPFARCPARGTTSGGDE